MRTTHKTLATIGLTIATASASLAGPFPSYSDPANQVQPSQIISWATSVADYSPAPGVSSGNDDPTKALGVFDGFGGTVSLGDLDETQILNSVSPGSITVGFQRVIFDGPGPDFAIFENASTFFTDPYVFAELAYVEVSSNGTDFVRFPSTSLNIEADDDMILEADELDDGFGRNFAGLDSTNVNNLAGYHPTGIGTPFDLSDLIGLPEVTSGSVDLANINYVRLVDIPGNGAFLDAFGNPILDTWLTTGSGGLDLDAVGTINSVPEPGTALLAAFGATALYLFTRHQRGLV